MSSDDTNVVIQFTCSAPKNWQELKFKKYSNTQNGEKHDFYLLSSEVSENVYHVAEELKVSGMDHAVARYNRRTGKVTYTPAKLFQCAPKWIQDPAVFLGEKRSTPVDYSKDLTGRNQEGPTYGEKRSLLTDDFGSSKKKRLTSGLQKRMVKEDTLKAAISSALEQTETQSSTTTPDEKTIIEKISTKAESSVLPSANMSATTGADVYSIQQIFPKEKLDKLELSAAEFFAKEPKQLRTDGYPEFVVRLHRVASLGENKSIKGAALLLLTAMIKLCAILKVRQKNFLFQDELSGLLVPTEASDIVVEHFFGAAMSSATKGATARKGLRYNCSGVAVKDKLMAHTLALALAVTDEHALLLPEWLQYTQNTEAKLISTLRALGCNVTERGGSKTAVLSGPPKATPVKKAIARRKTK